MIRAVCFGCLVLFQLPPLPPLPPPIPIPCLPVPIPVDPCPPLPVPPPADNPPYFQRAVFVVSRTAKKAVLGWRAADDRGIYRFLLFRDKIYLGTRAATATSHRFRLACGRHTYRVAALDAFAQRATSSIRLVRRCPQ